MKKKITLARFVCKQGDYYWGYRKQEGSWVSGYIELPTLLIDEHNHEQYFSIDKSSIAYEPFFEMKSTITHYDILNAIYVVEDLSLLPLALFNECQLYPTDYALWANVSHKIIQKYQHKQQTIASVEF